jgi:hypothetical protein
MLNPQDDWMLYSEFKGKAWPLTTYQAIILNIIIAMIREARQDLYVRCRSMLHAVTTTCITGGLFSYAKMRAQIEPTDSLLFSWSYTEEVKRLALSIYKLNVQFGTGMLKLSDLQFPLPDSGYLWDAQGSKEFYRRYNVLVASGNCVDKRPFICDLFREIQEGKRGPGLFLQADPWLGFAASANRLE